MTNKELAKNLEMWINILYPKYNAMVTVEEEDFSYVSLNYPEFEILAIDKQLTVLCLSWYYDFKEAEELIRFLEVWKLIQE